MPSTIVGFRRKALLVSAVLLVATAMLFAPDSRAEKGQLFDPKCLKCHTEFNKLDNAVAGDFDSISDKAMSFQVNVGDKIQIVKFTPETQVENVEAIKNLQKPIPVLVSYKQQGADLVATNIKAKPVIKVPEDKQLSVADVENLLKKPGAYTLVDSRPPINYQEGHIPTAISMPFGNMPTLMDKLPKDKNSLVVFYCGGFR
ncbi:MAG: hypothetical protein HY788_21500 [Deltaproteobacteria bacterium]|nr:hypothetical protein [Deltaproteobacteria bacterium]